MNTAYFRDAAEPLFSIDLTSAGEVGFRMEDVFPGCLEDATFLDALLLAITLVATKGKPTVQSLGLQGRAIQSVRRKMLTSSENLQHPDVGAILLLQGVAYRWGDVQSHEAHSQGLVHVRKCFQVRESCLTAFGERGMFWQDLSASLLIGSARYGTPFYPPAVRWRREQQPTPPCTLPKGFELHADVLPPVILDCVSDIVEMQALVASQEAGGPLKFDRMLVDDMQASIESRLAWDLPECPTLDPVAECVRLASLLTCFLTFNQTWPHSLVPAQLGRKLRDGLLDSMYDTDWLARRDLQLWCFFVGLNAMASRPTICNDARASWAEPVRLFQEDFIAFRQHSEDDHWTDRALTDFIYCDKWLQDRKKVWEWRVLEDLLRDD